MVGISWRHLEATALRQLVADIFKIRPYLLLCHEVPHNITQQLIKKQTDTLNSTHEENLSKVTTTFQTRRKQYFSVTFRRHTKTALIFFEGPILECTFFFCERTESTEIFILGLTPFCFPYLSQYGTDRERERRQTDKRTGNTHTVAC